MSAAAAGPRLLLRRLREIMAEPASAQTRLDKLVTVIAANMVAEVCSIYLRRAGKILELFATEGLNPGAVHATRLKEGEGLVGMVSQTAEAVNLPDASADPHFSYRPETGEELYKSFLGVPIVRGGQVFGVLTVQNKAERSYAEEEVEALQTVAMVLAELVAQGGFFDISELDEPELRVDRLYAQTVPQGGSISGTSAIVQLDAWNWEDALVKEDGVWMNWPSMVSGGGWWAEPAPLQLNKDYDKQVNALKDYFREAKAYYEAGTHEKANLRFEAMKDLFNGKKQLYVNVDALKEMQHVIAFANEFGVKLVIAGGADSWMMAEELAQKKVPVILGATHSLPSTGEADVDQPYKTPAVLQKAGVQYCLSIPGGFWQERNLIFMAGTAAAYGLTKEQALSAITQNTAKILGLDASIGTLEKGKDASLIVSTGDLLDMKSSNIEYAFISGRQIDLSNKQKTLSEKYMKKYKLN